jgi:eukaryotic-like serine/threonine-protein kinase
VSSDQKKLFWREDWFTGLIIVLAMIVLQSATDVVANLERRFYDFASTSHSHTPSDRIAIIAIDDQSVANIGQWPWPRDVQAKMIDLLAGAKAKVVANTVFFFEPQTDRGLPYILKLKDLLASGAEAGTIEPRAQVELAALIAQAEDALDTDAKLAASIGKAKNVLIPSVFALGEPQGNPDSPLPVFAQRSSVDDATGGSSRRAVRGQQPLDAFGMAAAGVGHLNQVQESDGTVRTEALLVNYFGKAIPSLSLLAALKSLNLAVADLKLDAGRSVQLGKLTVPLDKNAEMRPVFYQKRDGKAPFAVDSFYDVLTGKIPASKYADKIVIIGATAAGIGVSFPVPGYPGLSPAETIAHFTSSILSGHFIVQSDLGAWFALGCFILVAVYLLLGLPRLTAGAAAIATGALLLAMLIAEFILLSTTGFWLPLIFPAALLVLGHLALTTKRFLMTEAGKQKSDDESAETNRMMGLAHQGQGQLDMAFDRFRRVPLTDAVMDNLNNLALDFERKRQFNKAQAVYEHMGTYNKNFKNLPAKLQRVKSLSETVMLGGSGAPGSTMLLDNGSVEKPMLGRYQVEKELGKGAMGVVYQGKDPKIGRVVAIKTLALSQEFEGDALDDARERFFREAETAGRLQHQNIVTIFDAGEEHDLAYIAMEYLKGKDLVDYCKHGQLLPVPVVLSIVARVAEALAYAHRQSVVHRDIKPANIMYEIASDTVKVTDFGIARITDASKTKTGMVLGTPSFMSPEQIAGKKIDGRSDLYSLGVMLYQMLTGVLPFNGESMAELMFKIANEASPDIGLVRANLPPGLGAMVTKALAKQVEMRYQNGEDFAADLRTVGVESGQLNAASASPQTSSPMVNNFADNLSTLAADPKAFHDMATAPMLATRFEATVVNATPTSDAEERTIVLPRRAPQG